jgi:hypothetical protein
MIKKAHHTSDGRPLTRDQKKAHLCLECTLRHTISFDEDRDPVKTGKTKQNFSNKGTGSSLTANAVQPN